MYSYDFTVPLDLFQHAGMLVDACVRHGTHYVDLTGEMLWIRRNIDKHHAKVTYTKTLRCIDSIAISYLCGCCLPGILFLFSF